MVYVSKVHILRVIKMNSYYAVASESTSWCVPKTTLQEGSHFLERAKVAGSHLEAPSSNLVDVNRVLDTLDYVRQQNDTIMLIYKHEGAY